MDEELLIRLARKKRKHIAQQYHTEYDEFPVSFSAMSRNELSRNYYKVGKDLKIQKVDKIQSKKNASETSYLMLAKSLNIGYYLITPLIVGVFLGYWIDKILNTKPVFLLVLFTIGIISSFYNLWKLVKES